MPRGRQAMVSDAPLDGLASVLGGSGRERLLGIQRARVLAAMVDVAAERGVGNVTVARVVARSGVSRRTFYELFEDREACLLAACEDALEHAATVILPAYEAPLHWREKLRAGLAALLGFLEFDRGRGQLLIVGTPGAGPRVLERRQRVLAEIITIVDGGRDQMRGEQGPSSLAAEGIVGEGLSLLTAEGVVGGVLALLHARMVEHGPEAPHAANPRLGELGELLGPLMSMIVLPYLGSAAARRELAQPGPPPSNGALSPPSDPLRDLEMRLTYRTVRVLLAVGELSGHGTDPSNRQVGDAAGIRDQGQISKLLARLEQLGLIENTASPHAKGEPNAWILTERGANIREAVVACPPQH